MNYSLHIDNVYSQLLTDDEEFKELLWKAMRHREPGYFFSPAYKQHRWDGYREFFSKKNGKFLTGLLPEVEYALRKFKHDFIIDDRREQIEFPFKTVDNQFLNKWMPPDKPGITLYDYQVDLINQSIKFKRGIVKAPTGCHKRGQKILMYNGDLKNVEDIQVHDLLMGPDGQPRIVHQLCRGKGEMYKVIPKKGKSFTINEDHILTLQKIKSHKNRYSCENKEYLVDVTLREWLTWSDWKKHTHKLVRTGINFNNDLQKLPLDPYFLGVLLGDGNIIQSIKITNTDDEIISEIYSAAKRYKLDVKIVEDITYCLSGIKGKENPITKQLRELDLFGKSCKNKFIPEIYKTASRENRLNVLAGLLDTDGSLSSNCYDYVSKSIKLTEDLCYVARSLGLAAYVSPCKKASQNGTVGVYYRVSISGNTNLIPCKILKKLANKRKQKKNVLRTQFSVKHLGLDDYYGFTLDKDGRYLLDDFTITHNSGKTNIFIGIMRALPSIPILVIQDTKDLTEQNYENLVNWGFKNVGIYYGSTKKTQKPNMITCVTVQSIKKLEKIFPRIKAIFVDEVHDLISDVPVNVYKKMLWTPIRIGISATPFKGKTHKFKVRGHFGPVFKTKATESGELTTKELQERGILSGSICTFYEVDEPQIPYEIYQDAIKYGLEENHHLHLMVKKIAQAEKGRRLILVERLDQGDAIAALIPGAFWIQGRDDMNVRKEVVNKLKNADDIVAIVSQKLISKGLDVKIHTLINAAGGKATHSIIQRMGRGLRTASDKDILHYYDFLFNINDYLRDHSEERIKCLTKEGHPVVIKEEFDL